MSFKMAAIHLLAKVTVPETYATRTGFCNTHHGQDDCQNDETLDDEKDLLLHAGGSANDK
jgi:hypothetical protein